MNNYIENGYMICKSIGNSLNLKDNKPEKCNTKEDIDSRINFLIAHNLVTLLDIVVDKNDLTSLLDKDESKKINDRVDQAVFRQFKCDMMSDNISKSLSENSVRHIVLKGTEFKRFYPDNMVRTSSDIDVYVSPGDEKNADKVLGDMGFVFDGAYDNVEFSYKKEPRYYVELHTDMEGFSAKQKSILQALTDNASRVCCEKYSLNDNDFYIYSLFHLYKHFVSSGAGVKMFLDIYLIRKKGALDYEYIVPILDELGIQGFEQAVTKINNHLFEDALADDDIKDVVEFIFDSGTFGKVSNNRHLSKINAKAKGVKRWDQMKTNYGVGFDAMKKRYPVLERFPALYPFSFIHRFFNGIIHKRDVIKSAAERERSISKDRVDRYNKIFKIMQINIQ